TMLPVPEVAGEQGSGKEWFVTTPEGYFDCSANAARYIRCNINGAVYSAEQFMQRFRRPDLVRKALAGEKIEAAEAMGQEIPPAARFVGLKNGDPALADPMDVSVEVLGEKAAKEVQLF